MGALGLNHPVRRLCSPLALFPATQKHTCQQRSPPERLLTRAVGLTSLTAPGTRVTEPRSEPQSRGGPGSRTRWLSRVPPHPAAPAGRAGRRAWGRASCFRVFEGRQLHGLRRLRGLWLLSRSEAGTRNLAGSVGAASEQAPGRPCHAVLWPFITGPEPLGHSLRETHSFHRVSSAGCAGHTAGRHGSTYDLPVDTAGVMGRVLCLWLDLQAQGPGSCRDGLGCGSHLKAGPGQPGSTLSWSTQD